MLRLLYIATFGAAAGGCAVAVWRARSIPHAETRIGLTGLVGISGFWAAMELLTFFEISLTAATVAYQLGLIAGFATVGAWLYFCSAYTGHDYHRVPAYRYAAVAVFVFISALKLSNPIHGQYYSVEIVTTPFRHASVTLFELHWAVTILAYSLTAVGFYMLFEAFVRSDVETNLLAALVGITALPVVFNVFSVLGVSWLVSKNYEPIGVAVFALGALYVASDTFGEVNWISHRPLLDDIDEAVLIVDEDGRILTHNTAARRLFEGISTESNISEMFSDETIPREPAAGEPEFEIARTVTVEGATDDRHYSVSETPFEIGPNRDGRALVISDVTALERKRREVQRQSEQLEGLAAAIAHELRNALATADGNIRLGRELIKSGTAEEAIRPLEQASEATNRGLDVVEDLITATRLSLSVTDTSRLSFGATVREGVSTAQVGDVSLVIENDGAIRAERTRWVELVRDVARLAVAMDATELVAERTTDGVSFRTDGRSLPADKTARLFEYGTPVPHAKAGLLGPNVKTLAYAHGWEVSACPLDPTGTEIRVTGIPRE